MKSLKFCLAIALICLSHSVYADIWTEIKTKSAEKAELPTSPRLSFDVDSGQYIMLASDNETTALYKFYANKRDYKRTHGATNLPFEVDFSCYPEDGLLRCINQTNQLSDLKPDSRDIFGGLEAHARRTISTKRIDNGLKLKAQKNPLISYQKVNVESERHPFEFGGAFENIENAQDFLSHYQIKLQKLRLPNPPNLKSKNSWVGGVTGLSFQEFITVKPCVSILQYTKDVRGKDESLFARHEGFGVFAPNVNVRGYLLRQPIDFGKITQLNSYEEMLQYSPNVSHMIDMAGNYPYEMEWPLLDSTEFIDKTALKAKNDLSYYDHTKYDLTLRLHRSDIANRVYYALKYLQVHCALKQSNTGE